MASAEAVYDDPREQALMGFMTYGGESHESRNASHWLDKKNSSFSSYNLSKNINWETAAVQMSEAKEEIRKATGRGNAPLKLWECTNSSRYHADRLHTYRN